MMTANILAETNLPLKALKKGKVRDLYEVNNNLLIIATDRISAFDYILPDPIPSKGVCLTQLSKFWFDYIQDIVENHLISMDVDEYPDIIQGFRDIIEYRSMLVRKASVIPVECIVRGYISGSAWKSYRKDKTVCGIALPDGLRESDQFEKPLFTPSTKADTGHDINISFSKMKNLVGNDLAEKIKTVSLAIYEKASAYARKRGIIIADTKFEFGMYKDDIVLIDEVLTPDSSRFWPADLYEPGKSQPSYDKQFVRDYLESTGWDKNSSPPHLPATIISETQKKYQEAYEKLTGKQFSFSK